MRTTRLTDWTRWFLAAFVVIPAAAWAQSDRLAALDGKRISFTVVHSVNGISPMYGPFQGAENVTQAELRISGNSISGSATRTVTYHGQPVGSGSRDLSGTIGQPHNTGARGGNFVWVFDGHSLTFLTTYAVGGGKLTITFGGGGCTVRAPMMRETGAGTTRMPSVTGGRSTITSARQVSSSCSFGG